MNGCNSRMSFGLVTEQFLVPKSTVQDIIGKYGKPKTVATLPWRCCKPKLSKTVKKDCLWMHKES